MINYRPEIDGLRAIAVLLVVTFHAFPSAMPGGFIGVDVFFVISGYLITGIISKEIGSGSFSLIRFYARRARRIFPALIIVLAASLVFGCFVLLPNQFSKLSMEALAGSLFFPNILFWTQAGYFDQAAETKPLLHLWSLGVEEQFYLVWPWLLIALLRSPRSKVAGIAALSFGSLIYCVWATRADPTTAFYSTLSRFWELGLGGVLSFFPTAKRFGALTSFTGIILVGVSAMLINKSTPFPGFAALCPVLGSVLILASRSKGLAWSPLVRIGKISYPLYLWHWPLLKFAAILGLVSISQTIVVVAISAILAGVTASLIEHPIRFGRLSRTGAVISSSALLLVALSSFAIWHSGGALWRYPVEIRPVLETMSYNPRNGVRMGCWLTIDQPFEKLAAECRSGATVIWGDSHAAALSPALMGAEGLAQFTRDGCPPILGAKLDSCAVSNATILETIERMKPDRVILFAKWTKNNTDPEQLDATLQRLRLASRDVLLIGPAPVFLPSLPEQSYQTWKETRVIPDRAQSFSSPDVDATLKSSASKAQVRFISMMDLLCDGNGCLTHTTAGKSDLIIWDYGHLTLSGAKFVTDRLLLLHPVDAERTVCPECGRTWHRRLVPPIDWTHPNPVGGCRSIANNVVAPGCRETLDDQQVLPEAGREVGPIAPQP